MKYDPRTNDWLKDINVATLIQQSGVTLKQAGDTLTGLCPLHRDKDTPSLVVYTHSNSWACFGNGCGGKAGINGGDAIDWVMQFRKVPYKEAVDWLNKNYRYTPATIIKPSSTKASVILPVNQQLVLYWHSSLGEHRHWFHQRGFSDTMIDQEKFGWDPRRERYTIPVWLDKPGESTVLGVRLRRSVGHDKEAKYIGLADHNPPTIWGRYYSRGESIVLCFAGELDAARAVQDGLPAVSVVNGIQAFHRFPSDWPNLWFPDTHSLLVCFDRGEEQVAGQFAATWSARKGHMSARIIRWPPNIKGKDYNEARDAGMTVEQFKALLLLQMGICE
jgi:hypothetical protein